MNKTYENELEVKEWISQGRTEEQIYGVNNFLTGLGAKMIERKIKEAIKKDNE